MKKIFILILITALTLFSCKNNTTDVNTSPDNNNSSNTGDNNGNNSGDNGGNNGEDNNNTPSITPEELEKYGIDIASATTQKIEEALIKYEADHKGEYKLIFKGTSTAQYDWLKGLSIAGLINEISLKDINITITFEHVNFPNNILNPYILGGSQNLNENIVKVILPDTITTIGNNAFFCSNLTNVNIPKGLTIICDKSFSRINMKTLEFPNTLQTIGAYAFSQSKLESIVIPNSVTSIGKNAFESCENLIKVTLPNNLTILEEFIFTSCYALQSITIPASVKEIKTFAFYYAKALETVTFLSSNPPTIENYAFNGTALKTIYVPSGSQAEYEKLKGQYGIPQDVIIKEQ